MSQSTVNSEEFSLISSQTLSDYVTAVAFSPQGDILAATSAAGEVVFWQNDEELKILQSSNDESVDCVAFSHDGKFLAAAGQNGQVKIWQGNELITTLENAPAWVDKLAWSPNNNQLAFSLGRKVQVWDADSRQIVTTLDFDNSSALAIDWRNDGKYLAIGGHRGVKVWNTQWNDEPYILDIPSTSLAMAWSPDGRYLASGNIDKTIAVVESELLLSADDPQPWIMHGFPGKIRDIAWSEINSDTGSPLLACSSMDGIVLWEKQPGEDSDWEGGVLTNHAGIIQAIAFAPNSFLLASAASDGWLCLWQNAQKVSQIITGVSDGFTCMDWHPQAKKIAAGGDNGELLIFS